MNWILRLIGLSLFVFVLSTPAAEAACVCTGLECVAANLTKAEFDDCNLRAPDGATIVFPSGAATWTASVTITKRLNLVGAGAGKSVVTFGAGIGNPAFALGVTDSSVSGFTFQSSVAPDQFISARGDGGTGRIHHNEFINNAASNRRCIYFSGGTGISHPVYLVDHNTFSNCRVSIVADLGMQFGGREWVADRPWGVFTNVVYIEDNTFTYSVAYGNFAEVDYGGMMVVRYNTVSNAEAHVHGTGGYYDRSGRYMEVYGNSFSGALKEYGLWWRGGSGVAFGNTFTADFDAPIVFDVSTDRIPSGMGMPDGTKKVDGNRGGGITYPASGWPAIDQPGYGRYLSNFDGVNFPGMTPEPIPVFLNRQDNNQVAVNFANGGEKWISNCHEIQNEKAGFDGSCGTGVGIASAKPVKCSAGVYYWATNEGEWNSTNSGADGRLYKCVARDVWQVFYTPYAYPHPLATGNALSTSPLAAPKNFKVTG